MPATYTHTLCANFGAAKTGQAANVVAKVYDNANVLRATVSSWTETTNGGAGAGSYFGTFAADPAWAGGRVEYSITGLSGVGYVDAFAGDPFAAGVLPNAAGAQPGGLPVLDADGNVPANAARLGGQDVTVAGPITLARSPNGRLMVVPQDDETGLRMLVGSVPTPESLSVTSESVEVGTA